MAPNGVRTGSPGYDEPFVLIYVRGLRAPRARPRVWLTPVRDSPEEPLTWNGTTHLTLPLDGFHAHVQDPWLALWPRLLERWWAALHPEGVLWLHLCPDDAPYLKALADALWGTEAFYGELIWTHPPRRRTPREWPRGHHVLLGYAHAPRRVRFHAHAVDRLPYMAPRLVGRARAQRGKLPTDVWWYSHVRAGAHTCWVGYWQRLLKAHTRAGERVLVVGSRVFAQKAQRWGRRVWFEPFPQGRHHLEHRTREGP